MKNSLDDILSELRRKHQEVSAPPHLETRLRFATRSRRVRRIHPWIWAAAAMLIVTVATSIMRLLPPARPRQLNANPAGFAALPGSEALPAPAETIIVRMQLTGGVKADYVIGDDGLARAIRFIR